MAPQSPLMEACTARWFAVLDRATPTSLAQPLHAVACLVVGDELEAVHQRVSPAKYRAALRRMSRSSSSSRTRRRSSRVLLLNRPGRLPRPPRRPAGHAAPLIIGADPATQRLPVDPQVISDLRDRRARPRPVQRHRVGLELGRIVLVHHVFSRTPVSQDHHDPSFKCPRSGATPPLAVWAITAATARVLRWLFRGRIAESRLRRRRPSEIKTNDGGRGVYWEDPSGHFLEIITRPYGGGG